MLSLSDRKRFCEHSLSKNTFVNTLSKTVQFRVYFVVYDSPEGDSRLYRRQCAGPRGEFGRDPPPFSEKRWITVQTFNSRRVVTSNWSVCCNKTVFCQGGCTQRLKRWWTKWIRPIWHPLSLGTSLCGVCQFGERLKSVHEPRALCLFLVLWRLQRPATSHEVSVWCRSKTDYDLGHRLHQKNRYFRDATMKVRRWFHCSSDFFGQHAIEWFCLLITSKSGAKIHSPLSPGCLPKETHQSVHPQEAPLSTPTMGEIAARNRRPLR